MSRPLSPAPALAPAPQTSDEVALSDAYTPLLRHISARSDLQVRIARTTRLVAAVEARNGEPVLAPGAYWAAENVIELETSLVGDTELATIDPSRFADLTRIAQMHGVALHQAAHAAHTQLDHDALAAEPPAVRAAALLLEDVRAERRLLERRRPDAMWLRAAARKLLHYELVNDGELAWDAAKVAVLTCGRVDAGSLQSADVESARVSVIAALGEDRFARLQAVWQQALELADGDQENLVLLAEHFCAICGVDVTVDPDAGVADAAHELEADLDIDDAEDAPPQRRTPGQSAGSGGGAPDAGTEPAAAGTDADTEDTDNGGDEGADGELDEDALRDALRDALHDVATSASSEASEELREQGEIRDQAEQAQERVQEARRAEAQRQAAEAQQARADAEAAAEVFSDDDEDGDEPRHRRSAVGHTEAVRSWREPTGAEQAAAQRLASLLEQRLWRPPDKHRRTSQLPPGRLHTRGAIAQSVQIALGKPLTARPWKRTVRTPEPPLKLVVGLGVDRSGSMRGIIDKACSAAWIVANAAKRVDATFASVTFGEKTTALTRPGVIPARVPRLAANAGYETIGTAIQVLDGALNLTDARTVRLLCVVSDGFWGDPAQWAQAERRLTKLHASGCGLLLCNAGGINPAVPYMEKVELSAAGDVVDALAQAIFAILESA